MAKEQGRTDRWVAVIGITKLLKGLLLVGVAIGALKLLQKDLGQEINHWIERLNVDPNNYYMRKVLAKISGLDVRQLMLASVGTLFYAGLFLTEGIGLLLRKRWAEYFTLIVTGSFLPLEVYELIKHFHAVKLVVTIGNVAIVIYLIGKLRSR